LPSRWRGEHDVAAGYARRAVRCRSERAKRPRYHGMISMAGSARSTVVHHDDSCFVFRHHLPCRVGCRPADKRSLADRGAAAGAHATTADFMLVDARQARRGPTPGCTKQRPQTFELFLGGTGPLRRHRPGGFRADWSMIGPSDSCGGPAPAHLTWCDYTAALRKGNRRDLLSHAHHRRSGPRQASGAVRMIRRGGWRGCRDMPSLLRGSV